VSQANSVGSATSSAISSDAVASSTEVTASSEVTSSSDLTVPASTEGIIQVTTDTLAPGESASGVATSQVESEPQSGGEMQSGAPIAYSDSTYKFNITYPENFVVGALSAEKLAQLTPTPEVAVTFMNPVTAASDLGDAEPADLEIRFYSAGDEPSLEDWLTSNELIQSGGSASLNPYHAANTDGVRVCAPTMLALGCAYFVMGNGFIYQMTPASIEGEEMAKSFTLTS